MIEQNIGFLGAGNMAEAIMRGLLETQQCSPKQLMSYDINEIRLAHLVKTYGIRAAADQETLLKECSVILLAVKPQQMSTLLLEIKEFVDPSMHTLVSIAAGITTMAIEKAVGGMVAVVRVMPNTPARFLEGAAAFCLGQHAGEMAESTTRQIFESIGIVVKVEEALMDAITALSGSGPAYIFKLCEMMIEAGKQMGITVADAEKLSIQTIYGAAKMLKESGQSAVELREAVTSKGGTTQAALQSLDNDRFSEIFIRALFNAQERSQELRAKTGEA